MKGKSLKIKFALALLILSVGCVSMPKWPFSKDKDVNIEQSADQVGNAAKATGSAANNIGDSADSLEDVKYEVEEVADMLHSDAPTESEILKTQMGVQDKEITNLRTIAGSLNTQKGQLQSAEASLRNLEKSIGALKKENENLKEQIKSKHQKMLGFAILAGLLIAGLGVAATVNGSRGGIGIISLGATITIGALISTAVMSLPTWILGLVGLAVVIAIGYVIWQRVEDNRTHHDLVRSVEMLKEEVPDVQKQNLFGNKVGDGLIGSVQSNHTKDVVDKIRRTKIKKEINSTVST